MKGAAVAMTLERAQELLSGDQDLGQADGVAYNAYLERAPVSEQGFLIGLASEHGFRCRSRAARELAAKARAEKEAQAQRDEERIALWRATSHEQRAIHLLAERCGGSDGKTGRLLLALAAALAEHPDVTAMAAPPPEFRPDLQNGEQLARVRAHRTIERNF